MLVEMMEASKRDYEERLKNKENKVQVWNLVIEKFIEIEATLSA